MTKSEREQIRNMFGGCCAYCGKTLGPSFHVDHVEPLRRGYQGQKERESTSKLFPTCRRCNLRKSMLTLEQFRREISKQVERLRGDSAGFRLAEDFSLVTENVLQVTFYFERFEDEAKRWSESLQR